MSLAAFGHEADAARGRKVQTDPSTLNPPSMAQNPHERYASSQASFRWLSGGNGCRVDAAADVERELAELAIVVTSVPVQRIERRLHVDARHPRRREREHGHTSPTRTFPVPETYRA